MSGLIVRSTERRYPCLRPYLERIVGRMGAHGSGTIRQRRPGSWEIRVSVGPDVLTGRPVQRSCTVHGDRAAADQRRIELAGQAVVVRDRAAPPLRTVGDLLQTWISAAHDWKPATWQNYCGTVRRLLADPLAARPLTTLQPSTARAIMHAWTTGGMSASTAALNMRTLKAGAGWAYDERRLAVHPLAGMRGPGPGEPRRDVALPVVRDLLCHADAEVHAGQLAVDTDGHARAGGRLWQAEQLRLVVSSVSSSGVRLRPRGQRGGRGSA